MRELQSAEFVCSREVLQRAWISTCFHVAALLLTCCCTCRDAHAPATDESAASAFATSARSLWGSRAGQSSSREEKNA